MNGSSYIDTPNTADLDITGDLDLRCKFSMDVAATGGNTPLVARWNGSNSYRIQVSPAGFVQGVVTDGTNSISATASGGALVDGQTYWYRMLYEVATTSVKLYVSTDDGTTWVQTGATAVGSVTAINAGTAPLEIGSWFGGTAMFKWTVYRVQIMNGINGTLVADADFSAPATNFVMDGTVYSDGYRLYTIHGTDWSVR